MWIWSLNWGEITPGILIGTCPMRPADLGRIRAETGVSAVLSVQHDDCLAYWGIDHGAMREHGAELGLLMERRAMRDFDVADQREQLPRAVAALARLQAEGHRTYVHCTAGLGRSPLTVLAYLICIEERSPEQAIALIHGARPGAVPAWEAYHGFRQDLLDRYRTRIEQRAFELYRSRAGRTGDAASDWARAEAEVLRAVLTELDGAPAD